MGRKPYVIKEEIWIPNVNTVSYNIIIDRKNKKAGYDIVSNAISKAFDELAELSESYVKKEANFDITINIINAKGNIYEIIDDSLDIPTRSFNINRSENVAIDFRFYHCTGRCITATKLPYSTRIDLNYSKFDDVIFGSNYHADLRLFDSTVGIFRDTRSNLGLYIDRHSSILNDLCLNQSEAKIDCASGKLPEVIFRASNVLLQWNSYVDVISMKLLAMNLSILDLSHNVFIDEIVNFSASTVHTGKCEFKYSKITSPDIHNIEGDIIAYKILATSPHGADYTITPQDKFCIAKVRIPADVKRVIPFSSHIIRAEKVEVLEIHAIDSKCNVEDTEFTGTAYNFMYNSNTLEYSKGSIVESSNFDQNPFELCTGGIHCFISKDDALFSIRRKL